MTKILFRVSRFIFVGFFVATVAMMVSFEVWSLSGGYQFSSKKEAKVLDLNNSDAVIQQAYATEESNRSEVGEAKAVDARQEIIRRYLERYKSPMAPFSELIFQLSETYGFEYYWIPAIAQQESNLCKKIPAESHNCWGYGINSKGTLRFENYEIALKAYAEYLKREYFDKGLNTPELIMKKYCPHSDGSWARGVRQFIGDMETGDF